MEHSYANSVWLSVRISSIYKDAGNVCMGMFYAIVIRAIGGSSVYHLQYILMLVSRYNQFNWNEVICIEFEYSTVTLGEL